MHVMNEINKIFDSGPELLLSALKAVGEPTRLRLVLLTTQAELTVTELTQILRQSQPRVSRHLKLLCDAGLLERFREGTWVFYRAVNYGPVAELSAGILSFVSGANWFKSDLERLRKTKNSRAQIAENYFKANASRWNEIRSLHVPEPEVESELIRILGNLNLEKFLDVGTGTGRILEIMSHKVKQGWGIDLSREMLSLARFALEKAKISNCYLRLADMYSLPFDENSMNAVIFHQVLHFATEPQEAIQEAARVLLPGGQMLVVDFLSHQLEYLRSEHAHIRLGISDDEISNWFKASNMKLNLEKNFPGKQLTVKIWCSEKLDN